MHILILLTVLILGCSAPHQTTQINPKQYETIYAYTDVTIKPQPIRIVTPEYPKDARKRGLTGTIKLSVILNKDGKVESVQYIDGPEIFKKQAIASIKQSLFKPAQVNGKTVKVKMVMPVDFELKNPGKN